MCILFPPHPYPRHHVTLLYSHTHKNIYIYCIYELIVGAFSDSKCDGAGSLEIGMGWRGGGEGGGDGRRGFDNIRFYIILLLHTVLYLRTHVHIQYI